MFQVVTQVKVDFARLSEVTNFYKGQIMVEKNSLGWNQTDLGSDSGCATNCNFG